MDTAMRMLQRVLGDCGGCRKHPSQSSEPPEVELSGGYTLLQNHDMTMLLPEKQSKKKKKKMMIMKKQNRVAPHGCLCIYVGPERQRFVVKIEHASHPRFMAMLEDAAGTGNGNSVHNDGPIFLPCNVDVFYETLSEIMIADFDSSVSSDNLTSSNPSRSDKHNWARRLFKIARAF